MGRYIYIFFPLILLSKISSASDIWFSPNKTEMLNNRSLDSTWSFSRSHIRVFKFYSEVIMSSTVPDLREKFDFLRANNIDIAIELPALTWEENSYGYHIEGFRNSGFTSEIIKKIKMAGGEVDYLSLDEPITFGAFKKGNNYPQYSPEVLARKIYSNLKVFYESFPNVKVGDIEAFNQMPGSFYSIYLPAFLEYYKKVSGKNIDYVHLDEYWGGDWKTPINYIQSIQKKYNFRSGVIFNASLPSVSDKVWMDSAKKNIDNYLSAMKTFPDDIIIQSWVANPHVPVGDSISDAHSSLILYILRKER